MSCDTCAHYDILYKQSSIEVCRRDCATIAAVYILPEGRHCLKWERAPSRRTTA